MMLLYASACFTVVVQHSHKLRMWPLIFHTNPKLCTISYYLSHLIWCVSNQGCPKIILCLPRQNEDYIVFYWNPNLKDSPCEQRVTRAIHCDVFTAQNARVARLIQYRGPCIARCSGTAVSKQPPKWGFDVIWPTNRVTEWIPVVPHKAVAEVSKIGKL